MALQCPVEWVLQWEGCSTRCNKPFQSPQFVFSRMNLSRCVGPLLGFDGRSRKGLTKKTPSARTTRVLIPQVESSLCHDLEMPCLVASVVCQKQLLSCCSKLICLWVRPLLINCSSVPLSCFCWHRSRCILLPVTGLLLAFFQVQLQAQPMAVSKIITEMLAFNTPMHGPCRCH